MKNNKTDVSAMLNLAEIQEQIVMGLYLQFGFLALKSFLRILDVNENDRKEYFKELSEAIQGELVEVFEEVLKI